RRGCRDPRSDPPPAPPSGERAAAVRPPPATQHPDKALHTFTQQSWQYSPLPGDCAQSRFIRYHGVFAPASPDRARVVPRTRAAVVSEREASVTDQQRALTWAQRLKRVFAIDIETCRRCGGRLRVIASIEEPATIERILAHLGRDAEPVDPAHPAVRRLRAISRFDLYTSEPPRRDGRLSACSRMREHFSIEREDS